MVHLELPAALKARLIEEAARAHPQECCGLLLGRDGRVEAIAPARNIAADPLAGFEIDPAALFAAHKAARAGGPPILGYYHSHPTGSPCPSALDAARADEPGKLWLIIADGGVSAYVAAAGHERFLPIGCVSI